MFAFEQWHSALEMKLYIQRFIHHIGGLPDLSALKFTKYNQYESLVLPMVKYLEAHGVQFQYGTKVVNVVFDISGKKRWPRRSCSSAAAKRRASISSRTILCSSQTSAAPKIPRWGRQPRPGTRIFCGRMLAALAQYRPAGPVLRASG